MSRVKKPVDEKLVETINTPVTRGLKKHVREIARKRSVKITVLTRSWFEREVGRELSTEKSGK